MCFILTSTDSLGANYFLKLLSIKLDFDGVTLVIRFYISPIYLLQIKL